MVKTRKLLTPPNLYPQCFMVQHIQTGMQDGVAWLKLKELNKDKFILFFFFEQPIPVLYCNAIIVFLLSLPFILYSKGVILLNSLLYIMIILMEMNEFP